MLKRHFPLIFTVLIFSGSAFSATILEKLEASVNSQLVLKSDLDKFRKTVGLRMQLDPLFAGTKLASDGAKADDDAIREFLIRERLILQSFPMTDTEVETEINSIQAGNRISRDQLRNALAAQGYAFPDYFDLIRIGAAKRTLLDREIRTKVTITDDDVRNYYYTKYANGKNAQLFYHIQILTNPSRKSLETAVAEIKSGVPFAEVAKKYSIDESASQGGDLGTLPASQLSPFLKSEVTKLKVGQLSSIISPKDKNAPFIVLKVADVKSSDQGQYEKISGQIRSQLAAEEYQRQLELWVERQTAQAFIHRSGQDLAAELHKGP